MTGFVDPAFKNIKVTEPNFIIWRLSKLEKENYEAKLIRREYFGNFYDEDTYIVYSSTPMKKVLWRPNSKREAKMEIHIHFWLGSNISESERIRTIVKIRELDEVLEGAGTLHREVQGYESMRFLSYFKKGLFIRKGDIATALKQNLVDSNGKLFALSQRSSTLIFTEQPSASWTFMNSSTNFALVKQSRVFVWIGSKVGLEEKHLVFQLEKLMKVNSANRKVIWVYDGRENELTEDELADFEQTLVLKCKNLSLGPVGKDFLLLQSEFRNLITLYKVIQGNCTNIAYVKDGPLEQSDLDSMDIGLIHHSMNGIWIWVRKKLPDVEKSRSINIAMTYLDEKLKLKAPEERKLTVSRVVEGSEPQEFKLLFSSWIDTYSVHPDHYFLKKPGKAVNKNLRAEMLEEYPFLAAETRLFDLGGGEVSVARIDGGNLVHLDPEDFGIFHSQYKYLVCYTYKVNGNKKNILYCWLGNGALAQENEDVWPALKHIPEFKEECIRVRIEQFMETSHFYSIFQGKMLVLNSPSPITKDNKMVLDRYPLLLFKVIGGDVLNTLSVEVTPEANSLCSDNVFIIRTPGLSYVWCGARTQGDEREMARSIALKWTKYYHVIFEGCESPEFQKFMSSNGLGVGWHQKEIVPAQINVPARLYKCSLSEERLRVSEILNFEQSDLGLGDIIILDVWNMIFVWIGEGVSEEDSLNDTKIVFDYLHSDPCGRVRNLPIVYVPQNQEPPAFRGFFPTWTKTIKKTPNKVPKGETTSDPQILNKDKISNEVPGGETASDPPQTLNKDEALSDYEFWSKFGMSRKVFNQYPLWKQKSMKTK